MSDCLGPFCEICGVHVYILYSLKRTYIEDRMTNPEHTSVPRLPYHCLDLLCMWSFIGVLYRVEDDHSKKEKKGQKMTTNKVRLFRNCVSFIEIIWCVQTLQIKLLLKPLKTWCTKEMIALFKLKKEPRLMDRP